ncbi:MAG: ATP-binding protein [Oscillospiraceae bacterium]|nr:ATP-binding protein [Oscillospiraceae bacterium]
MKKSVFAAKNENLDRVTEFILEQLEAARFPKRTQMQIKLAVEEIFVNIASYAYAKGTGTADISVDISDGMVRITFEDSGAPFDPLAEKDPDVTLPAEKRRIGGLGIFLVRKLMDHVSYEYKDGRNILTIEKKVGASA